MAAKKTRGRKPDASSKSGQIREMLKTGMSPMDIAKKLGCTPGLVYNVKARATGGGGKRRGPGRPPKAKAKSAASSLDGIASILDAVKGADRERARLRSVLEQLQNVIASALA